MKIKIHQKDLLRTLNILEKGLPNRTVIESLKGIKIETKKDEVRFMASKSELAISYTLTTQKDDIEIIEQGSSLVSGSHLINIIRKLNTNYINLETKNNELHIQTGHSHIELIEYELSSYPLINFALSGAQEFTLSKSIFQEGYDKTKYSISDNQLKQILTGVNFNFSDDQLVVSSTDSLRMTYFKIPYENNLDINLTISKHILQSVIKILDLIDDEEIKVVYANSQFVIKTESLLLKSKLIDGDFPQIEKLIPQVITYSYEAKATDIVEALERVVLLTDKNESVVTANLKDNQLYLSSFHKALGGIEEICIIKNLKGNPFKIAFDPRFILEAIYTFNTEDLLFEFVDEVSGFVVKPSETDDLINVISPIRMI